MVKGFYNNYMNFLQRISELKADELLMGQKNDVVKIALLNDTLRNAS